MTKPHGRLPEQENCDGRLSQCQHTLHDMDISTQRHNAYQTEHVNVEALLPSPEGRRKSQHLSNRSLPSAKRPVSHNNHISPTRSLEPIESAHHQSPEGPIEIPPCLISKLRDTCMRSENNSLGVLQARGQHGVSRTFNSIPHQCLQMKPRLESLHIGADRRCTRSKNSLSDHPNSTQCPQLATFVQDVCFRTTRHSVSNEMCWEIEALRDPHPRAPVTKENLKELDLYTIQNTITLRYDLCFDQGLFFQRVTGQKGSEKKAKAEIFYRYLCLELEAVNHNLKGPCSACQDSGVSTYVLQSRLKCYFTSLLDLLIILVPEAEKEGIKDSIEPDFLTRQVRTKNFDAVKFSAWLYTLLTRHCAPMRDEMAREMHEKISQGASDGNMKMLSDGMATLLNLLENMKIDIANHQIRTFKLLLIADTVPFLKDCFAKMLRSNQIKVRSSRNWYAELSHYELPVHLSKFERFMYGLVSLTCATEDKYYLPTTFGYDDERLQKLRNDIFDHVQLRICLLNYRERSSTGFSDQIEDKRLEERIMRLMCGSDGSSEGVRSHVDEIDCEIKRAVSYQRLQRSSPKVASKYNTDHIHSPYTIDARALARVKADPCLHEEDSESLQNYLDRVEESELKAFSADLFEQTIGVANQFLTMETLHLSNYQRNRSEARASKGPGFTKPDITDISCRLAHLGVIHWQVWAELAYLDQPQNFLGSGPGQLSSCRN